jgi:hypothetical protein
MGPPQAGDSRFYGWLYRFTHLLAANLDRALGPLSTHFTASESAPEQPNMATQDKKEKEQR